MKRQFPAREDLEEQLLTNILGVAIGILVLLLTTAVLAVAFFLRRRGAGGREDSFKLRPQNSTESSGNNFVGINLMSS